MELKAKSDFFSAKVRLLAGHTTTGRGLTEDFKQYLLKNNPTVFEVLGDAAPKTPVAPVVKPAEESKMGEPIKIETPESALVVETPEAKMPKTRKK